MINTLQCFHTYLKTTENWCYNLISNLPETKNLIAAKSFEKCNFYNPQFTYLEFPLRPIEPVMGSWIEKKYNKFVRSMLRHGYPAYVGRYARKVDLVHSHFSFVGWEYRRLAQRLGVPHVVSFYGFDYEWLPRNEPKWIARYKIMFNEIDMFLCEGNHGVAVLRAQGCPEHKLKVARLGVDTLRIPFLSRTKKTGELNLLQVASLTKKKGHCYTILAFLDALKTCPQMSLTLVGKDTDGIKTDLLHMIPSGLLNTKIRFIDWVEFSRLHELMSEYHVFIHPSCYSDDRDCEGGAPVVLLDAQATGMPVIASTHCDIPSVVRDGTTGLLAPEKDSMSLSYHISRFYEMAQPEYDSFSKAARQHTELEYNIATNATLLRGIYQQLLHDFKPNNE